MIQCLNGEQWLESIELAFAADHSERSRRQLAEHLASFGRGSLRLFQAALSRRHDLFSFHDFGPDLSAGGNCPDDRLIPPSRLNTRIRQVAEAESTKFPIHLRIQIATSIRIADRSLQSAAEPPSQIINLDFRKQRAVSCLAASQIRRVDLKRRGRQFRTVSHCLFDQPVEGCIAWDQV